MSDVFLDGKLIGTIENPKVFVDSLITARREGKISNFLNVNYDKNLDSIDIFLEKNRIRRPLIIVNKGIPLLTNDIKERLKNGELSWDDLVMQGIIEYLDTSEEERVLIALNEKDLTEKHTHLEINPVAIFSICSSLVPYSNFTPSARFNIGSKSQKQSVGIYALNYLNRLDTSTNLLHYPQIPITHSFTEEIFGDKKNSGQNVVIAIMNYDGYNIEDSIVISKASIDRGFGRISHYRPYSAERLRYPGGQVDQVCIPDKETEGYGTEQDYRFLNEDGIIYPEAEVTGGDVLIGKTSPPRFLGKLESFSAAANVRKDTSVKIRSGEKGLVTDVFLTESIDGNALIKINTRDTRSPEIGDKFSSRHGQKGILGYIVPVEDMPFTASGIVPDIIFSPNGLPKRMTVNQLIEALCGKVGSLAGRRINGTAFQGEKPEDLRKELLELGFREDGTETMYDGRTGKQYEARIFVGNIYYMRLKYQVADKVQARARGPVQLLTRQPTEGKAKEGGLRLGEMEKESLIGHGASLLVKERFSSDKTIEYVCEKCGDLAIFDRYKNKPFCLVCGEKSTISPIELSYAFKLFLDELKSLGIKTKLELKDKY